MRNTQRKKKKKRILLLKSGKLLMLYNRANALTTTPFWVTLTPNRGRGLPSVRSRSQTHLKRLRKGTQDYICTIKTKPKTKCETDLLYTKSADDIKNI
jgi:hypothetical protein